MFWKKTDYEAKKIAKQRKKQMYDKVYQLHQQSEFLCYINEVYLEKYKGEEYVKLEGLAALGVGAVSDHFLLFDCQGRQKAEIDMEEIYIGNNPVERIEGGDKQVALYPKQQDVAYKAGDILCILKTENELK